MGSAVCGCSTSVYSTFSSSCSSKSTTSLLSVRESSHTSVFLLTHCSPVSGSLGRKSQTYRSRDVAEILLTYNRWSLAPDSYSIADGYFTYKTHSNSKINQHPITYITSTLTCIKNFSEEHKKKKQGSTPELPDKQQFFRKDF